MERRVTKFTAIGVALVTGFVFHGGALAQFGPHPRASQRSSRKNLLVTISGKKSALWSLTLARWAMKR